MNIEELIKKGKDCYKQGHYSNAQLIFSEIIESDDKNAESYFFLGNIFHIKGELGKAIKAFKKVLEIDPDHTDASISLAVLYNDISQYDEAKKIFDTTSERVKGKSGKSNTIEDGHINKQFSQKHYELAEMYLTYNRYDEALFEYNKAWVLNGENLELRLKTAKVYAKKGFVAKAFEELRKLKNEHPHYIPTFVALGVLHYANGSVIEAQNEWKKVLVMEPTNQEAAMYLNLSKTATETRI